MQMKKKKVLTGTVVLTLLFIIGLTACGGQSGSGKTASSKPTPTSTNPLTDLKQAANAVAGSVKEATDSFTGSADFQQTVGELRQAVGQAADSVTESAELQQTLTELRQVADTAADSVKGAVKLPGGGSASDASWSRALDDYERFVDEYVVFMKQYQANLNDMTMVTQYASMLEKSQKATDSIQKVQGSLSGADLASFMARYGKMAAKLASVML